MHSPFRVLELALQLISLVLMVRFGLHMLRHPDQWPLTKGGLNFLFIFSAATFVFIVLGPWWLLAWCHSMAVGMAAIQATLPAVAAAQSAANTPKDPSEDA